MHSQSFEQPAPLSVKHMLEKCVADIADAKRQSDTQKTEQLYRQALALATSSPRYAVYFVTLLAGLCSLLDENQRHDELDKVLAQYSADVTRLCGEWQIAA